jgi:3-hydroxyacyl-CoA dehydrogenase/enoyl-CoA hydratase/3-hydroxybutyryl-CoA epimerase/enoyl-CoA isomerase
MKALHLKDHGNGIAELCFDLTDESVNKFNSVTLNELKTAVTELKNKSSMKGLLITSKKDVFIVGADITEFLDHFKREESELAAWIADTHQLFNQIEDLNVPVVCAINGICLGGGMELALTANHRVMAADTKIGLPETKLGIFPGWGGTVRLSRLIGADNAIEWIASGTQWSADQALKYGAVDAVVPKEKVFDTAMDLLRNCIDGKIDWKKRQDEKRGPLHLNPIESMMVFEGAKAFVSTQAGPNYPAPLAAIEVMQKGATLARNEALAIEAKEFARIAKTPTAYNLVTIFLGDQYVKKISKKWTKNAENVKKAGVLGAGIMGGGIAYQSASTGTPILMKDIAASALELGMAEVTKLLDKQVSRGKMTPIQMAETISRITPTLSYADFKSVDFVVEAVVENEGVKKKVLQDLENEVTETTVVASNTSTISITRLAEGLKRPELFCGMHFFNPVHRMPLVEIIRGKKTSDATISKAVAYATAMGKTPIVVNDCPGFLVNRVLFPYFSGFLKLVNDGVDFTRIDQVMEKFGWPMGPAYLLDVVGIDTAHHANAVMASEFSDRMKETEKTALDLMYELKRFGQKNGKGFYTYVPDKKGPPKKQLDPEVATLLRSVVKRNLNETITDAEIIDRMMLPMIIECSRCLEEKIVDTPVETDIALIYGLGFPPFRGGALRYADREGIANLIQRAEKWRNLGKLYEPTEQMKTLAKTGKGFYV